MVSHGGRYAGSVAVLEVLILIVMDNGLSPYPKGRQAGEVKVLILIVMDNGLSRASPWPLREPRPRVLILIVMDNGLSLEQTGRQNFREHPS